MGKETTFLSQISGKSYKYLLQIMGNSYIFCCKSVASEAFLLCFYSGCVYENHIYLHEYLV